ncbi:TRAF3-interacting protein 1 isoform X2 [Oenanthe melanoleuca]|uniref:TRAF3-interacting protein 1 isoform X2 n=1 Tax=Oenanthe melanoleuca TaxID=2939378 RepID=UPI0024C17CE7|nr:TRAF3-interacting protein 1 isoform X2 [Oenanthe melanoleuca]
MNEAVSRQTRETLGQVIRKPPLTDALLSKPPFRYLHDLISEVGVRPPGTLGAARQLPGARPERWVIRVTGFLKGLYTDFELKSDNVKDKDSKINFLQKAIDAVVMVTGEPLSVKPARVVAGHEPEKTNEFLQAIGKCCLNKLSSDAAVKRVLAGEKADVKGKPPPSKPRDKESREPKAEEQKTHRNKESRRDTEVKDRSPSRDRKPKGDLKESREREKEKDKKKNNEEKHKEPERETSKEGQKQERERSKSRTAKQGREIEKNKGKGDPELRNDSGQDKGQEREKRHEEGREKDRLKGRDKNRDREGEKDRERGRDRDREKDGEHFREHGKEKAEKKPSDSEESVLRKPQRPTKDSKCQPDTEIETPARISEQPSAKGSRHRSKPGGEGAVDTRTVADGISEDGAAELQEKNEPGLPEKLKEREVENVAPEKPENGEAPPDVPPQPAQRRTPRPGSARPAPPRVKRQESTELLIPERSGSAKTTPNVIREQQVSDEEDEQFVVESAVPLPEMLKEPEVELLEDQKHGGLVKRILETKKDYEASQKSSQITDREKPVVLEASRKKERDLVAKEIEKFQVSIQTVCQNAFRLGRIVDYIQEDMDAMRNELHTWRQENRQHAEALQREQSITDSAVEPLKADLAELEQLIKDQQDKICAVKANILRNEEKIQRMVLSINLSSRR